MVHVLRYPKLLGRISSNDVCCLGENQMMLPDSQAGGIFEFSNSLSQSGQRGGPEGARSNSSLL